SGGWGAMGEVMFPEGYLKCPLARRGLLKILLPACGEKVPHQRRMRGAILQPSPLTRPFAALRAPLSPRSGERELQARHVGRGRLTARPSPALFSTVARSASACRCQTLSTSREL